MSDDDEAATDGASLLDASFAEPGVPCAYTTRDLLLYSLGIGCSSLCHVHEDAGDFAAFPTYPVVLGFKGDAADVVSFPSPAMLASAPMPAVPGTRTVLDAERYVEMVRPLPPEGASDLVLRSRVVGAHQKLKGVVIQTESELRDAGGELLYRMQAAAFAVGARGLKSAGVVHSQPAAPPDRAPDATVSEVVPVSQALVYRLSGDYNALHIDPDMAMAAGFERPILHGLCSLGYATRHVLDACADGDPARFKAVRARFSSPVLPGDTLVTRMWKVGRGRIAFVTVVERTGKPAITNAYVDLADAPPASSL